MGPVEESTFECADLGDVLGYLQELCLELVVWLLELVVFWKLDELAEFVF